MRGFEPPILPPDQHFNRTKLHPEFCKHKYRVTSTHEQKDCLKNKGINACTCLVFFVGKNSYKIRLQIYIDLKSWKTTIRVGDTFYKTFSQDPKAEVLSNYLQEHFPGGNYYSAYEASFSGFKAHRELTKLGINNMVVNPADIPTTDKDRKQKEDSKPQDSQLATSSLVGIHIYRDRGLGFRPH